MLIHSSKCNPHYLFFMAMEHRLRTTPKRRTCDPDQVAKRGNQRRRRAIFVVMSVFEIQSSVGATSKHMPLLRSLCLCRIRETTKIPRLRRCGGNAARRTKKNLGGAPCRRPILFKDGDIPLRPAQRGYAGQAPSLPKTMRRGRFLINTRLQPGGRSRKEIQPLQWFFLRPQNR